MTSTHPKTDESFATLLWRVTSDSHAVGEPVTWLKLAEVATRAGVVSFSGGHRDARRTGPQGLAEVLHDAYETQARLAGGPVTWIDWHAMATFAEAQGWRPRTDGRSNRTQAQRDKEAADARARRAAKRRERYAEEKLSA